MTCTYQCFVLVRCGLNILHIVVNGIFIVACDLNCCNLLRVPTGVEKPEIEEVREIVEFYWLSGNSDTCV